MADITKYYSLTDDLKQYGQVNGESNPNATTMQDMQSYMQQNGDTLENVVKAILWQPETSYIINQEVHSPNMPAGYMAICSVAGTTGTTEPSWSTTYETFEDGTATWKLVSLYSQKVDKNNTTSFTISAGEKSLIGDIDETLKWVGNDVDSVVAKGSDGNGYYIRYASGLQICLGYTETGGTDGTVVVTLPQAFIQYRVSAIANGSDASSLLSYKVYNVQTTSFKLICRGYSNSGFFIGKGAPTYWIAIGNWK